MKIKIKQNKMEIIKGHKFYDIWGRNDLLFVKGVEGSGIFEQLNLIFEFKIIYFINFFNYFLEIIFTLEEKLAL